MAEGVGKGGPLLQISDAGEALMWATEVLHKAGCESFRLDAQLLLGHLLGWSRARVLAHPERVLNPDEQAQYRELVARRAAREPLAYIVGQRAFWGMDFWVRPGVLIPRPETELLVEQALAWALEQGGRDWAGTVVDMGTGSGAVIVALARELPRARCWGTEASEEALAVARENLQRHGVAHRVSLVQGDLLEPLSESVECIVSNPPYVTTAELAGLPPEISRYEPREALDGGVDGLAVYRRLIPQAAKVLRPKGALFLEIGCGQAEAVTEILEKNFPEGRVLRYRDLGGHWRVVAVER
ncbi:MAG: peptide chain release factor N(5)-glutamine methyltransferase [Anaerolineae bacterium]